MKGTQVWYKAVLAKSINGWKSFEHRFSKKWSYKQDNAFMLSEFSSIEKKENAMVLKFNTRFTKAYHKILQAIRPNADFSLIYYVKAFDESIGFLLREKDSQTLEAAMIATIKIEKYIMDAKNVPAPLSRLFDP